MTCLRWWFHHRHQDPDCVELSRDDWRKLNMRFSQTVSKRSSDAAKAWEAASLSGQSGRTGKVAKQHEVIKAWLIDPSLGHLWRQNLQEIFASETHESEEQWMAKKEVLNYYSDSELEEAIETGEVEVRKNPKNKKRLQFKRTKLVKKKSVGRSGKVTIRGEQAEVNLYIITFKTRKIANIAKSSHINMYAAIWLRARSSFKLFV